MTAIAEISIEDFLILSNEMTSTCPADEIEDRAITFVKNEEWLIYLVAQLRDSNKELITMVNRKLFSLVKQLDKSILLRMRPFYFEKVERKFIEVHNHLNATRQARHNLVSPTAVSHPTAIIGADSMRIIYEPGMREPLRMKHMGNVVIGDGVNIGPYAVVHQGSMGSTVIGDYNHIGAFVNIGHSVKTGKFCAFTPYVCVGGSARIGSNVVIGMGAMIRDNIKICGDVKVGMGSTVVKSIDEPGLYYGSPAERKGDWNGEW